MTKQQEKIESELQNINNNLGDILKRIDHLELSVSESDSWSASFFGMAISLAALGLLLAGAHIWFVIVSFVFGLLFFVTSFILRIKIRRKQKSKINISS